VGAEVGWCYFYGSCLHAEVTFQHAGVGDAPIMKHYIVSVHKVDYFVIPAKAGIQNRLKSMDSRFHACALKRYGAQARE